MEGTRGRTGRAWLIATLALALAVLGQLSFADAAWAEDPPDVRGLSVAEATTALLSWDKSVVITFDPPQKALPPTLDPATVVVAVANWLNPTPIDPAPPQVELLLGSVVPDLTGLTRAQAEQALVPRGLGVAPDRSAADDWVVRGQRPLPGSIALLGRPVTLIADPPASAAPAGPSSSPAQNGGGGPDPTLIAVAATAGAVLLLGLVTALVLRRSRLRRGRPHRGAGGQVEVRAFHGQVLTPEVITSGPDLSVRVTAYRDPGSIEIEEARR